MFLKSVPNHLHPPPLRLRTGAPGFGAEPGVCLSATGRTLPYFCGDVLSVGRNLLKAFANLRCENSPLTEFGNIPRICKREKDNLPILAVNTHTMFGHHVPLQCSRFRAFVAENCRALTGTKLRSTSTNWDAHAPWGGKKLAR